MDESRNPKTYERTRIKLRLLHLLLVVVWTGGFTLAAGWIEPHIAALTASRWIGLLGYGALLFVAFELISLPMGWYDEFRVEHAYDLSNQTPRGWIVKLLKEWLIGGILGAVLVGGMYAALWYSGRLWWLWVWLGWLGLSVGLARLFPVLILPLFYPATPLENESLRERFLRIAAPTRLRVEGIFKLNLSKDTKKANAMLTGLGNTRRVYLSDTLLDAFNEDEVGMVFAHELGHHVHGHIGKGIALSAVLGTLTVGAIAAILSPYASTDATLWAGAVARLPAVVLAITIISFVLNPLIYAILRHFERQADWQALELTQNADAYRTAMHKLGEMNLADPEPPQWIEVLFHDHPALGRRIAAADAWERAKGGASLEGARAG